MNDFIDLGGGKHISTRYIYLIREAAAAEHTKNQRVEIRALGEATGGFVENRSVEEVAKDLIKLGVELTVLPSRKAAVRDKWITAFEPFEKAGTKPQEFGSLLEFTHGGVTSRTAVPDPPLHIPGAKDAVRIARPGGRSPQDGALIVISRIICYAATRAKLRAVPQVQCPGPPARAALMFEANFNRRERRYRLLLPDCKPFLRAAALLDLFLDGEQPGDVFHQLLGARRFCRLVYVVKLSSRVCPAADFDRRRNAHDRIGLLSLR
jgi:hypothetical protein